MTSEEYKAAASFWKAKERKEMLVEELNRLWKNSFAAVLSVH